MKPIRISILLAILIFSLSLGCSLSVPSGIPGAESTSTGESNTVTEGASVPESTGTAESTGAVTGAAAPGEPALDGLARDRYPAYSAIFEIQFSGAAPWSYRLASRKTAEMREDDLHIEGVPAALNPGDVRLVTNGATTWMIGPGTDNECVQFPNNEGMDPTFIFPESMLGFSELSSLLAYDGEVEAVGRPSRHFSGSGLAAGAWQDARIEVWQDPETRGLLGFTMQANGEDPFFGSGSGSIYARYAVQEFTGGGIEPVAGCEIGAPLPEAAQSIVRLPGMSSFKIQAGVSEMATFYQSALPQEGWAESEAALQGDNGAVALTYARGAEGLEVQIEPLAAGGCTVKLVFLR